ncbi:MAG: hypothetical protein DYG94_12425 [Leptolyngbya sp. PLA3]|nr:MAG: hypothetical protein EDM82_12720 [Cyanobacteria bacterium CYA]MCE7969531.1 hypothetical protein [Leptolyngbya sp. PL-A3]
MGWCMTTTMSDRFRVWYDYERDCNAKTMTMLESVPRQRRAEPDYPRACAKFAHMVAARWMWLHRLGGIDDRPETRDWVPGDGTVDEIRPHVQRVEAAWSEYLSGVSDDQLARSLEWVGPDGTRRRWAIEELLVQVFGHAWYHRGQIATLVADLGGQAIDTDYIFWSRPEVVG